MSTKKLVKMEETDTNVILLPKGMSILSAIESLKILHERNEEEVNFQASIDGYIDDSLVAFAKALERIFGWYNQERQSTFFGTLAPVMLSIQVGVNETVNVPFGKFTVPTMDGIIKIAGVTGKNGLLALQIGAVVKRRDEEKVKQLVELVRQIVSEESIYKGKAFKIEFRDGNARITFLDVSQVQESDLIFSRDVENIIKTCIFTPLEKANECRELGIPLKRGILLSGKYGTGKTLTAYVTAKKAIEKGFTFVYCTNANDFSQVVKFAQAYMPAVVFCEDIDRVTDGERTSDLDQILNTIDGLEAKKNEMVVVLTTNHVEEINKAMLRPGRLDAVINVTAPDAEAVTRLIRFYGRDLIDTFADLRTVGDALAGQIPAVIRECVERAKLAALKYHDGNSILKITEQALLDASLSMENQLALLQTENQKESQGELLERSLKGIVSDVLSNEADSSK